MAQQLKSWESPRRQGRNDKGKGGSARARQIRKQQQMMRQKLKGESPDNKGNRCQSLFLFYLLFTGISPKPQKTQKPALSTIQKNIYNHRLAQLRQFG